LTFFSVHHSLNVTREIDNFFPGMFNYLNIRVYDDEKTDLLKHWDNTFKYITRARWGYQSNSEQCWSLWGGSNCTTCFIKPGWFRILAYETEVYLKFVVWKIEIYLWISLCLYMFGVVTGQNTMCVCCSECCMIEILHGMENWFGSMVFPFVLYNYR
jgi:hypothetical protein